MADVDDDPALAGQIASARPELDPIRIDVVRASAVAALFGTASRPQIGRYELLREVGTGGGGSVFVARDPELARDIALKVIPATDPALRARAVAEGQALAKLAHPNVVPVFDVGVAGDRVYLAMELVRGESLRSYVRHATARAVIDAYRQACDGLIAAHAAGLVHRDFKPDNAVIGDDGRVRIVDFGLAGADTRAGTPAYMAPEHGLATVAADQYAFAVSLREALDPLPRWLASIVRRATAMDPDARFPSMAALGRALANDPAARWRRRTLIAAPLVVVALALGAFVVGRGARSATPSCDPIAALAPAWTARAAVEARIHAASLGVADRASDELDHYAMAWRVAHRDACSAARTEPSARIVERRTACLAAARSHLGATLELLRSADREDVPGAARAVAELPSLSRCADVVALADDIPPPRADQQVLVAGVRAALERVRVSVDAARADAVSSAESVVASARALGYRPLLAQALLVEGHALDAVERRGDAVRPLTEAVELAIPVRDDATAVEAYARLIRAAGADDASKVLAAMPPVLGLAERVRASAPFAVALLHNNAGVEELAAGHTDRALSEWRTALPIAREVATAGAVELAWVRTNLALASPVGPERDALLDEAVQVTSERLGVDHPLSLRIAITSAFSRVDPERARIDLRQVCDRFAVLRAAQHAEIADCSYHLALLEVDAGETVAARAHFARAAALTDVEIVQVPIAAAWVRLLDGDREGASRELAALAARVRPGPDTEWYELIAPADIEYGRALLGDPQAVERAIGFLERAARTSNVVAVARRLDAMRLRARR